MYAGTKRSPTSAIEVSGAVMRSAKRVSARVRADQRRVNGSAIRHATDIRAEAKAFRANKLANAKQIPSSLYMLIRFASQLSLFLFHQPIQLIEHFPIAFADSIDDAGEERLNSARAFTE